MGQIANELLALNTAKHAIRDAINLKGGGPLGPGDPMSDYPSAITAIPTGGDTLNTDIAHRVVFIDWDGEVLLDTYVNPGAPVTPPTTPAKWNGYLTFSRWTATSEELSSVKYDMCVGACYTITETGVSAIIVAQNKVSFLKGTGSANVDWGDGTVNTTASHVYDDGKEYIVKVYGSNISPSNTANAAPFKVFQKGFSIQLTDGNSGNIKYLAAAGFEDGHTNGELYYSGSSFPRVLMKGFVNSRSNGTVQSQIYLPPKNTFYLACPTNQASKIDVKKYVSSTTYIALMPIFDTRVMSIDRSYYNTIIPERIVGNTFNIFSNPASTFNRLCLPPESQSVLAYQVMAVGGRPDAAVAGTIWSGARGCNYFLHNLPNTGGATKTLSIVVYNSNILGADLEQIISELQEKGYTVNITEMY